MIGSCSRRPAEHGSGKLERRPRIGILALPFVLSVLTKTIFVFYQQIRRMTSDLTRSLKSLYGVYF